MSHTESPQSSEQSQESTPSSSDKKESETSLFDSAMPMLKSLSAPSAKAQTPTNHSLQIKKMILNAITKIAMLI